MDITLNDDQALLRSTALSFAKGALTPARIRELETTERGFDGGVWREMAQMGWAGAPFPEAYGGADIGLFDLTLVMEALGQGAVPSPLFASVIEAGLLLLNAGSEAQKAHWLPAIASGETLMTAAVVEPSGGLAAGDTRTTVAPAGNGFRLDGVKLFVRDAAAAEAIIVLGRSGERPTDLSLAIVPGSARGVTLQRLKAAGGEALYEVRLEAVTVGADAIVGEPGGAWPFVQQLIARGAAFKAAELTGVGQAALDLTLDYARTRIQFGKPIGSFQGVHHHCAEMYRDLEVTRLLAWQAAAALGNGNDGAREVAFAKAKASEAIPALTRTAHQIHGAIGYYRDYPLELYYHRALAAAAAYGDAAHHRRALATLLTTNLDAFRGPDRHDLPVHYF